MQKEFSFDVETIKKIARGAIIAGLGAMVITFLDSVQGMDFGASTPIVTALASIAVNAVREYIKGE